MYFKTTQLLLALEKYRAKLQLLLCKLTNHLLYAVQFSEITYRIDTTSARKPYSTKNSLCTVMSQV